MADGHFEQVSFVNNIATIKGGTHVDYITNQIADYLVAVVKKQNKYATLKDHDVKNYLWVFVNALIENPAFGSRTKETLILKHSSFGSTCELSPDFMKKVVEDFFHLRLDYYERRKTALLRELGKATLQLENKVRFFREIGEGTLVVSYRKKADLYAELKVKGYTPLPKKAVLEASIAGAVDHVDENEEGSEEETAEVAVEEKPVAGTASKTIPGTEYDYLLSMATGTLTYDKMQQLWHERDTKKTEFFQGFMVEGS